MRARRLWGAVAAASVALTTALVATPAGAATDDGLVGRWKLDETSGTVAADSSGHGRHAAVTGAASWNAGDGFTFSGGASSSGNAIALPDGLLSGLDSVTVDFDVHITPGMTANYFLFTLGNPASLSSGTGYVFVTGSDGDARLRGAITTATYTTEQSTTRSAALATGSWRHLTYTIVGGTPAAPGYAVLYEDGVEVARNSAITVKPSQVANGGSANFIGRSAWAGDKSFQGKVRDFRVYDRALTSTELTELASDVTGPALAADAAALTLGDTSAVRSSLTLPTLGSAGSAITWASSNPAVVSTTGVVTRPAAGAGDATVTLTATLTRGSGQETKQFTVTVLERPTAPGLIAEDLAAIEVVNVDDVRGNLTLPTAGANGTTFTWASSDPTVVDGTGRVHRPAHGQPTATVTLTATGALDGSTATRTITATVPALPQAVATDAYLFAYFEGESTDDGESIYLGASQGDDPTKWDDLNDAEPVLTSEYGERGLRDPFIIRSPEGDKFYMIATDLKIYPGGSFSRAQQSGSTYIEVWESTDLVTWSDQRHVKVSTDFAGNTWAPEAYYDEDLGAYVVYWASNLYPTTTVAGRSYTSTYNRMMYATTRDFVTFSEAQPWMDVKRGTGLGMIDATIVKDGSTYYRFVKDEASMTVRQEKSTDLLATVTGALPTTTSSPGWRLVKERIGVGQPNPWGGTFTSGEGPTAFKANGDNDSWYLFIDQPSYHGGRGYMAFTTTDIAAGTWTALPTAQLPSSRAHGTVLPITQAELDTVRAAYQPDLLVESVDEQVVTTDPGVAPVLPAKATAHYADGSSRQVAVTWDAIDPASYAVPGEFTVAGRLAGGVAVRASLTVRVTDEGDPVVTLTPGLAADGSAGWWRSPSVPVTASATDVAGIRSVEVKVDDDPWVSSASSSITTTVTGEGRHVVQARATDGSGRTSAVPASLEVGIDTVAPVSRATFTAATRTVAMSTADDTSGVARTEYRVGSGSWKEWTGSLAIGAYATTVQYRSVDVAGNTEVVNSLAVPAPGKVAAATRTYADAASAKLGTTMRVNVEVTATAATPTGTVRILKGGAKVGSGTLSRGKATVAVQNLGVGTHRLTVVYDGTSAYAASQTTLTVKVTRASSTTKATVTSVTSKTAAKVTVKVTSAVKATGKVTVTVTSGGKPVATRTGTLRNGAVVVTLPKLAKGTYSVKARYAGSSTVLPSTGATRLVVKAATARSAAWV
ncbi:MAG: Ig-like domain repeat protein [Cellulomonas sp.]|nr:immunoglobulin-like domain-containing protein [Cellulomonas sp.]MCR6648420.1 Ig-like domain repeat protein [Cellulomonas sp.]